MLTLESLVPVDGLTGKQVTDFLLDCEDARYQAWWPGTHLQLHAIERGPGDDHVGDVVLMDELIGSRRVRMAAEVVELVPGERLVWRMRWRRVRLPVRLTLTMRPQGHGVLLRHVITAGWSGPGRLLDPLWRLYFSRPFEAAMDRHAHTEFPLLRDLLHGTATGPGRT